MALSGSLQGFHAYAQFAIADGMKTGLFKAPTLLGAVASRQTVSGSMGEPGVTMVIGKPLSVAKQKTMGGSTQRHIPFQTQRTGGGKYLGEDGTTSTTGVNRQDKNKRTTAISWSFYEQPIAIRNMALRLAGSDEYAIGSIIEDAVSQAINEANEQIGEDLWNGSPSDQTSDVYDDLIGVDQWIDDNNVIGSINRASVTGFNGVTTTSATVVSLKTLEDAALDNTSGIALKGSKRDLAVSVPSVYKKLKLEALAAGGQLLLGERPQGQPVGFTGEFINYNNTMIIMDPYAHNAANDKNYLLITDTSTWCLETHAQENWSVKPFRDESIDGPPGSDDVTTSKLRVGLRWYCEEPWKSWLYADVS